VLILFVSTCLSRRFDLASPGGQIGTKSRDKCRSKQVRGVCAPSINISARYVYESAKATDWGFGTQTVLVLLI